MTGQERLDLRILHDYMRDWRREDTEWKASVDQRLRAVEIFVAAEENEADMTTAAGISRRAYLAVAASVVGTVVAGVLGVVNLLT